MLACGDTEDVGSGTPPSEPLAPPAWEPGTEAAWVFDEGEVRTYELEMPAEEWEYLKAHARDEQYQKAALSVDGEPVGEVGLRFKGGIGTLRRCTNGSGALTCPKGSLKIKFDEYEPERRFHGLKRLNLHSIREPSHLHERLGYRLFREMGVAAPRAVHSWLVMNGEPLGLFASVENVDGRFTDAHFEEGDGNLYKEQWPGQVDPSQLVLESDDEAPDHGVMVQLIGDLAAAEPAELGAVVARYLDIDNLFAYVAVDRAISNWDGITAFYCSGGGCRNHNQYLYQHEDEPRFSLIPWDLDNTFAASSSFEYVPSLFEVPADCSLTYRVYGDFRVMAPGCDPLLRGLAQNDRERYRAQQARLLEGPFELEPLQAWVDAREAQLLPFVTDDPNGPGLAAFRAAVAELRRDIRLLALRLRAERDGQDARGFRMRVDAPADFEAANPVGVQLGVLGLAAPESSFEVTLGEAGALGGARDLDLSFTFAGAAPESRWARFALRFDAESGHIDLTRMSALRLVVQADAPRVLRISFASSNYSQFQTGTTATLGWDVSLDGTRQQVELPFSAAAFPESVGDLPDTLESVLGYARGLQFDPLPLASDQVDSGQIRIDDIQIIAGQ
jgi:spore coat protein H